MGSLFGVRKQLGQQKCPKSRQRGATTKILSPFWRHFGALFSNILYLFAKKHRSEICIFFLRFLGRPERSKGWAHMQSVHAGAVQTHFSMFAVFLKRIPTDLILDQFWEPFSSQESILSEHKGSKKCFKKRCHPRLKQVPISPY